MSLRTCLVNQRHTPRLHLQSPQRTCLVGPHQNPPLLLHGRSQHQVPLTCRANLLRSLRSSRLCRPRTCLANPRHTPAVLQRSHPHTCLVGPRLTLRKVPQRHPRRIQPSLQRIVIIRLPPSLQGRPLRHLRKSRPTAQLTCLESRQGDQRLHLPRSQR